MLLDLFIVRNTADFSFVVTVCTLVVGLCFGSILNCCSSFHFIKTNGAEFHWQTIKDIILNILQTRGLLSSGKANVQLPYQSLDDVLCFTKIFSETWTFSNNECYPSLISWASKIIKF